MIAVIHCNNCNADRYNGTAVSVEFRAAESCPTCYRMGERTDRLWFCSPGCFTAYVLGHPELAAKTVEPPVYVPKVLPPD